MSEPEQIPLFDKGEWWEEHWKQMPEYVQKDLMPFKTIFLHFDSRENMNKFSELIGQKIGIDTKSIWYPEAEINRITDKRYIAALEEQLSEDDES